MEQGSSLAVYISNNIVLQLSSPNNSNAALVAPQGQLDISTSNLVVNIDALTLGQTPNAQVFNTSKNSFEFHKALNTSDLLVSNNIATGGDLVCQRGISGGYINIFAGARAQVDQLGYALRVDGDGELEIVRFTMSNQSVITRRVAVFGRGWQNDLTKSSSTDYTGYAVLNGLASSSNIGAVLSPWA